MRVPAVSFAKRIAVAVAVGLLAYGLALPHAPAFAEWEDVPSALLASSLMDGSASVVREDVALAAPEDDAAPEPVIGSFTVDGLTFAVTEGSNVQLVGVSPDWQQATGLKAGEGSSQPSMPASETEGSDADSSALLLSETVAYNDVEYAVVSIGAYVFYLSGVTSVELPASIVDVDDRAFRSSDVASVEVADGNPTYSSFDGALYDADQLSLLLIPEGKQGTVLLPSTAESAAPSVFSHCPLVTQVSVEEGSAAFASENGLLYDASLTTLLRVPAGATDITIREGCTTIAAGAMEACASLATINAPASVTSISPYLFEQQPETVMAPVAVAAAEGKVEGGSAEEGEPDDAVTQLTAMVTLSAIDDGLLKVDASSVSVALSYDASIRSWQAAGFVVGATGESETVATDAGTSAAFEAASFDGLEPLATSSSSAESYALNTNYPQVSIISNTGTIYRWNTEAGADIYTANSGKPYLPLNTIRQITFDPSESYVSLIVGDNQGESEAQWYHVGTTADAINGGTIGGVTSVVVQAIDRSTGVAVDARVSSAAGISWLVTANTLAEWANENYCVTVFLNGSQNRTITWHANQGIINNSSLWKNTYTVSSSSTVLPVPVRSGYRCTGWWTNSSGGSKFGDAGARRPILASSYVNGTAYLFAPVTEFYAQWEEAYTVTYSCDSKYGTSERGSDRIYASENTVTLPKVEEKDGYIFNGWKSAAWEGEGLKQAGDTASFMGTKNETVTAVFTPTEYLIKLVTYGGTMSDRDWTEQSATSTEVKVYDRCYTIETNDITLPSLSYPGYVFEGWTGTNGSAAQTDVTVKKGSTGDRSYYANWKANSIKIVWDANSGVFPDGESANETITTYSPTAKVPVLSAVPRNDGYDFDGWYTDRTGGTKIGAATALPTQETIYYAHWKAKAISITWNANDGTFSGGSSISTTSYTFSNEATLMPPSAPSRSGHLFAGWWTEAMGGKQISRATPLPSSDVTYYAHWEQGNFGPVVFQGTSGSIIAVNYGSGDEKQEAGVAYCSRANVTQVEFVDKGTSAGDGYLHMAAIDGNGDTFGFDVGLVSSKANVLSVSWVIEKDDGSFETGKLSKGETLGASILGSGVAEPKVTWPRFYINSTPSCTVTWDASGGTVDPATSTVDIYSVVKAPVPMRDGYLFCGWYDEAGNRVVGGNGMTPQVCSDVTYYAHWEQGNFGPVVFQGTSGSIIAVNYGSGDEKQEAGVAYCSRANVTQVEFVDKGTSAGDGYLHMAAIDGNGDTFGFDVGLVSSKANVLSVSWVIETEKGLVRGQLSKGETLGVDMLGSGISNPQTTWPRFYINYEPTFTVTWDASGGTVEPTMSTVVAGSSVVAPDATRSGYILAGWFDATQDDDWASIICKAGEESPPVEADITYYAHWIPAISADAPLDVTVSVDLLGIEDQVPVSGYIESRSGGALKVAAIDFTPLDGATALFGASASDVALEALAGERATTADVSFSLDAKATETDASKLAAFALPDGFGTRIPIGYRFAIPEDVLASINPATFKDKKTPACSVYYTVALAASSS